MDPAVMDAQTNDGVTSPPTASSAPVAPGAAPAGADGGQQQPGQTAAPATPPSPDASAPAATAPAPATAPASAPESYTFELPEEVSLSKDAIGAYSEVAKELNLPQEQAQAILAKVAPHMVAHQNQAIQAVRDQWNEQSINDPEFGGDKLTESLGVAKRAVDAFASPALNELLAKTGLASNPEMIRLFYKVGKAVSPDGFIPNGGSAPASQRDAATILFGSK